MAKKALSHLDRENRPKMVEVIGKKKTGRSAKARATVQFPPAVAKTLGACGFLGKKGSIIDAAVIAGVMGAKKTPELIPLCHGLAIEACDIAIEPTGKNMLAITCTVATVGKTGVEMEALTGASIAALTIYDMCKALSHDIRIVEIRLLEKKGGKRGIWRADLD